MLDFINTQNSEIEIYLKRAVLFAEDGDFAKADEYCEKVLNMDPQNAIAYCIKLMTELKVQSIDEILNTKSPLDNNNNFKKILRFGNEELVNKFNDINLSIKQSLYGQAKQLVPTNPKKALRIFETISDYEESEFYISNCKGEISDNKKKCFKKIKRISIIILAIILVVVAIFKFIVPAINYNKATELMNNGKYQEAIAKFTELGDYKDSKEMCKEVTYRYAIDLCEKGELLLSLNEFMKVYSYKDSMEYIKRYNDTSYNLLKRLTKDGKIDVDYYLYDNSGYVGHYDYIGESDIEKWRDITSISIASEHIVGLKKDGTVIARGHRDYSPIYYLKNGKTWIRNFKICDYGQSNVENWTNIIDIFARTKHTIGLRKDGTVVATGDNSYGQCNVEDWTDIADIYASSDCTIGLKKDGTVVATGDNSYGQYNVGDWTDITNIYVSYDFTIGLRKDGTVVATGNNKYGQCNTENWKDVVAISASEICTIGLKSDGTVVGAGYYNKEIENWKDIVAIDCSDAQIIGLKKDGTVVTTGNNGHEKHNTYSAKNVVAIATAGNISYMQQKDGTVIESGFYGHYHVRYNNKLPTLK